MSGQTRWGASRTTRLTATATPLVMVAVALGAVAVDSPAVQASSGSGAACLRAVGTGAATAVRARAFVAAARTYRVPVRLLKAVSYLESRWDDHGTGRSVAGGYGPMNLTDVHVDDETNAKGDGTVVHSDGPTFLHTLRLASSLTGLSRARLVADPTANICGGAAVVAHLQHGHGRLGAGTAVTGWSRAVGSYAGEGRDSRVFVGQVYRRLVAGAHRVTPDGQRLSLAPDPTARLKATPRTSTPAAPDCPRSLDCEWIPAPYEWYGEPDPAAYGNHDLADRPHDLAIKYIVIHDTEGSYDTTIGLVQDPTYVSWQYTIRSADGHVAEHVRPDDVAWHAGNWYVNMHAIGIEHEGYGADASWYTESMYESSAALVRYLAHRFRIPLDRGHIIGHDQVPGTIPSTVAGMHWDPGPYWDWEHYFDLLGAPIARHHRQAPGAVRVYTVKPGYETNVQPVSGCDSSGSGNPCADHATNFVYVHTAADASSPLVADVGLHPDGSASTTDVADIGARLAAGQQVVSFARSDDWVGVWYLGQPGWVYSPRSNPVLLPGRSRVVVVRHGATSVPVYGRAYPEQSAYPADVPYQVVTPLQYSITAGQSYALIDSRLPTDYYYATTYTDGPYERTAIRGKDRYYEIFFGHRVAFVRAADVAIR